MSLVVFGHYMSIGEALVVNSALQAGGFQPSFHNYHHAYNNFLQMLTLGGLIILIPKQELNEAEKWIQQLRKNSINEATPITSRKYGMWKRASVFTFLSTGLFLPLFLFIPILFALTICGFLLFATDIILVHFFPYFALAFFFSLMILHIKYIALPKLKALKKDMQ